MSVQVRWGLKESVVFGWCITGLSYLSYELPNSLTYIHIQDFFPHWRHLCCCNRNRNLEF